MTGSVERLAKGEFTLEDFRKQLSQIGRLGPLQKVMGLIPGMGAPAAPERLTLNAPYVPERM
jgi:signal recognition particle GTPase